MYIIAHTYKFAIPVEFFWIIMSPKQYQKRSCNNVRLCSFAVIILQVHIIHVHISTCVHYRESTLQCTFMQGWAILHASFDTNMAASTHVGIAMYDVVSSTRQWLVYCVFANKKMEIKYWEGERHSAVCAWKTHTHTESITPRMQWINREREREALGCAPQCIHSV